jgi:hypothetical protein
MTRDRPSLATAMDQTNSAVSNRRARRGWISYGDTSILDLSPSTSLPSHKPSASLADSTCIQSENSESRSSLWLRTCTMSNVLMLQIFVLLRSNQTAPRSTRPTSRTELGLRWIMALYLVFSISMFKPLELYYWLFLNDGFDLGTQSWPSPWSATLCTYAHTLNSHNLALTQLLIAKSISSYGVMTTSFTFSKLAPHLGNLAPNAVHLVLDNKSIRENSQTGPSITTCIWIQDTYLKALDKWVGFPGCKSPSF